VTNHLCRNFPLKHALSLQRRNSLAFDIGTFAFAKDQASLPHNGLLGKIRHYLLLISFALNTNFYSELRTLNSELVHRLTNCLSPIVYILT